jgi:alkanesulfonate monooxygenase SsuD/methylene tetrahydromethanopterin reductase-like flavin-dependent oxidoreductase (luciferase family)
MKILWFHLMPYPYFSDDFQKICSSVWVNISPSLFDNNRLQQMYSDYIDELVHAAESGFDAVCVNEHHSNGYGMMPSPNLIASILARCTTKSAICVMGNSIALYDPPTRVAEEFAMIDCISGGRLIAGFPVGTPMDACFAYSSNPSFLREKYYEAHDFILKAWTSDRAFSWNGNFFKQRYVNPLPRPFQKPFPPIWIPGGGSTDTWSFCAENDYVYCNLSYFGYEAARQGITGFWSEIERLGKDKNPYRAGLLQFVGVAESREEAMRLYKEPAEYFYNRCLHVDPGFGPPPGYVTEGAMRIGLQSQVAAAADGRKSSAHASRGRTIEEIAEKGYVILGSPDEIAQKVKELSVDLHVGNLLLLCQYGNMSKELTQYNTSMFAKHVIPQIQDVFKEWEHQWWPENANVVRT